MSEEESTTLSATPTANPYLMPVAIVIAGIFIAGAIFVTNGTNAGVVAAPTGKTLEATVLPVTADDHVRGAQNPDVYLIEYSDYQCPFCTRFHATVEEVLAKYDGKVAWVYRHFPLDSIHPEARPAATAAECAAELGGEEAFWSFTDAILSEGKQLSQQTYMSIAADLGIDGVAYEACLSSGKYDDRIQSHLDNGAELGGNGTPYTVLLTRNGDTIKFSGALPIDNVSLLVERALRSLE